MKIIVHMTEEEYEQFAAYKKDRATYEAECRKIRDDLKKEASEREAKLRVKVDDMCSLTLGAFDFDVPLDTGSVPQLVDIDSAKKLIEEAAEWYS